MFAPKYLENKLKFFPHIAEAVTFGHERDYTAAFINIDLDAVSNWAERNGIVYASYQELAAHPRVYGLIQGLHRPGERGSRRRSAALVVPDQALPRASQGASTPTTGSLPARARFAARIIAERYTPLIDALYSGAGACHIDTEVVFEDGRRGQISADLKIDDVEVFPGAMAKAS